MCDEELHRLCRIRQHADKLLCRSTNDKKITLRISSFMAGAFHGVFRRTSQQTQMLACRR